MISAIILHFSTDKEVYVDAWDRWAWRCSSPGCEAKGVAPSRRLGPCPACGGHVVTKREAAVLDLEVRPHDVHGLLFDVTVVHTQCKPTLCFWRKPVGLTALCAATLKGASTPATRPNRHFGGWCLLLSNLTAAWVQKATFT